MDTRGKTNAEFRNEVNEALARHESNFDWVHTTLQTVLTEIQALRSTRSSHHPDINSLAQEDPLTIHTPHRLLLPPTIHHHIRSSCSFRISIENIQWGGYTRPSSTSNTKALELISGCYSPLFTWRALHYSGIVGIPNC